MRNLLERLKNPANDRNVENGLRDPVKNPPHDERERARSLFLESTQNTILFLMLTGILFQDVAQELPIPYRLTLLLLFGIVFIIRIKTGGKKWSKIYRYYKRLRYKFFSDR